MELVAVLYNIRSVHNAASVFRTADAAGFGKIYLCGITPAPLDRFGKVRRDFAKVALGAESWMPWEPVKSAPALLRRLRRQGFEILALEQAPGSESVFKKRRVKKAALIVGDEVRGLAPSVLKLADRILEIPMRGRKESLNVGVAFGIAAYALTE